MNANRRFQAEQLTRVSASRRKVLQLAGGITLLGAARGGAVSAQTSLTNEAVDALYDSAAAMPHLFAECAFPFVRRNWKMNGRGTLFYSLDTAVAAEAVTPADAGLLGEPDALYLASFINPEGTSWSTARYLTIANYGSPDEAAGAAARFKGNGVPAGGSDLTANLDPSLGEAISYAVTTDLSGTPAEQVFSIFAAGNWLFRYSSLTPQLASITTGQLSRARSLPMAIGEDVAQESGALVAAALTFNLPELAREVMRDKGYTDDEINDMSSDLFPSRFAGMSGVRIDYVKHNSRDYAQYALTDDQNALQKDYYAEAMCVVADEGPIPPSNTNFYYSVKRFFHSGEEARAFFDAMPTPAQQASHAANGVTFQDDPDGATADTTSSYISWLPAGAPSTFPGYGYAHVRGPIVTTLNVYNVNPAAGGPAQVDPAHPVYQSLRSGVMDLLEQRRGFAADPSGWPVFQTPEAFSG